MEIELTAALRAQDWSRVVQALVRLVEGVRGVVLYGSRSRGQEHEHSDYDLLVLAAQSSEELRREWDGLDLDVDVVDQGLFVEPLEGRLYVFPGRVLFDPERLLTAWLERLGERRAQGPEPWSQARRLRHAAWLQRMLRRSQGAGPVAAVRRAQLAASLPEHGVELLGQWPGGAQSDLACLAVHWPELEKALLEWSEGGGLEVAVRLCRERLLS